MFFRKCMRDGIALSGTVFYFGFVIVLPSVLIIILKKNMERVQDKMNKSACMLLIIGIICIALCGCGEQMNLYGTPDCPELSWEERRELTMSYEEAENVWNKIERRLRTRYDSSVDYLIGFPECYAGYFIDRGNYDGIRKESPVLTIFLTEVSDETKQIFYDAGETEKIRFVEVPFNQVELSEGTAAIRKYNEEHDVPLGEGTYRRMLDRLIRVRISHKKLQDGILLQREHPCIYLEVAEPYLTASDLHELTIDASADLYLDKKSCSLQTECITASLVSHVGAGINSDFTPRIEVNIKGRWYTLSLMPGIHYGSNMGTYHLGYLKAGAVNQWEFHLDQYDYQFHYGKYRIVWPYSSYGSFTEPDHAAVKEFTISILGEKTEQ